MSQRSASPLKFLVISMGLVLIGGFIFVASVVWKKVATDSSRMSECPGGNVDLKGHGIIIESKLEDQILRLTMEKHAGKNEILTIDACNGKVLSTLGFETDPGMVEE